MLGNKYFEELLEKAKQDWKTLNGGEKTIVRMYASSKEAGYDRLVSGWSESVQESDAGDFVNAMQQAGIREFYFIGEGSNQLSRWLALDKAGLKLCGICELDNPLYADDMEKCGESNWKATLPALKFVLRHSSAIFDGLVSQGS